MGLKMPSLLVTKMLYSKVTPWGLERQLSGLKHLFRLQKTWGQFSVPMWFLTVILTLVFLASVGTRHMYSSQTHM